MKKITALCFFLATTALFPIDLGFDFTMGNMEFADDFASTDNFDGLEYPWALNLMIEDQISEDIKAEISLNQDPILRRYAHTLFVYRTDFFSVGLGPTFGILNNMSVPLTSGLATSFKLEIPAFLFLSIEADNSLGASLVNVGDYVQSATVLSGGGYVPGIIWSLNMTTKSYSEVTSTTAMFKDSFTEYAFKAEMFKKNTDFHVDLNVAYQIRSKSFTDSTGPTTSVSTLQSLVLGFVTEFKPEKHLILILGLEGSIYTFGLDTLSGTTNPGPYGILFNANAGMKLSL
jgi:hypothetical protein